MKNIIFICCLIAFSFLAEKISAQAPPQKMTYQFVARNAQNQLIQNNAVGIRISIYKARQMAMLFMSKRIHPKLMAMELLRLK